MFTCARGEKYVYTGTIDNTVKLDLICIKC